MAGPGRDHACARTGERYPQGGPPSESSGVVKKPASIAIEKAKRGDPEALGAFLQRYERALYAYFSGPRHWHWDLVPDLVQETMARVVTSFPKFRGSTEDHAERWLYGIARNVHFHEVSRQVGIRLRRDVATELARHMGQWVEDPWLRCDICTALDELPLPQLEALRLTLRGLTVRQIAARLDVPEGTVATRVHRARNRLRARLGLGVPDTGTDGSVD